MYANEFAFVPRAGEKKCNFSNYWTDWKTPVNVNNAMYAECFIRNRHFIPAYMSQLNFNPRISWMQTIRRTTSGFDSAYGCQKIEWKCRAIRDFRQQNIDSPLKVFNCECQSLHYSWQSWFEMKAAIQQSITLKANRQQKFNAPDQFKWNGKTFCFLARQIQYQPCADAEECRRYDIIIAGTV